MEIIFATGNENKVNEIQSIIGDKFSLKSLKEIGFTDELAEDQDTLIGNALQKARFIFDKYQLSCFADDTGLEIEALDNRPGVYSARYAGEDCDPELNMAKVLDELMNEQNRKAKFRTVIALIHNGEEFIFEGEVGGEILKEKRGLYGFGYDPIFKPTGFDVSFAEMWIEQKNKISHRAIAVQKLTDFLKSI